jgi:hypothetical protein
VHEKEIGFQATDEPGAAAPQPHSNNSNGKKIDGKKIGPAALKTLAHFLPQIFFHSFFELRTRTATLWADSDTDEHR